MIDYRTVITEDLETLLQAERSQKRAKQRDRIRMLRLLKSGAARSLPSVAELLGLGIGQVRKLFNRYRKEGLTELCRWHYQGNHRKLSKEQEAQLIEQSGKRPDGFTSQAEVQTYIVTTFGVQLTQPGISNILARNGVKLKVGRPRNILTLEEDQQKYKKNSLPL